MSFANKVMGSGSTPIHFVTCKDLNGYDCYYFLLAPNEKIKMLKQVTSGQFDLNDYGKILASGYGLTPSEEVKKKLLDDYGFDANTLL
jgi:hypothetical protein